MLTCKECGYQAATLLDLRQHFGQAHANHVHADMARKHGDASDDWMRSMGFYDGYAALLSTTAQPSQPSKPAVDRNEKQPAQPDQSVQGFAPNVIVSTRSVHEEKQPQHNEAKPAQADAPQTTAEEDKHDARHDAQQSTHSQPPAAAEDKGPEDFIHTTHDLPSSVA